MRAASVYEDSKWVATWRRVPSARARMFCFPHAGGSASFFRTWPDGFPASVDLRSIQLPGRENRMAEEPLTSLAPVVSSLVPEIRPLLDIPYVFFGHSMGGLIAFELARELRRANYPQPAILLLSGRPAPHLASDHQPLHTMPTSDFLRAIRELGGTPPEIFENAQILELVLPTLRADLAVTETYAFKPDQPLDAPFSLFYGWDDASATEADMHPWCRHTTGGFSLRGLPGGHFFPQTARSQLLAAISADLAPLLL